MNQALVQTFITLFVTIDPIGCVPLFLSLTRDMTPAQRRKTAIRGVIIAAIILIVFILVGQRILDSSGISIPAFQMAGGVVLILVALQMVFHTPSDPDQDDPQKSAGADIAVFPLAMPFIAGPGAMIALLLLTDHRKYTLAEQALTTVLLLAVLAVTLLILLSAQPLMRIFGRTGTDVVTRVLGLILCALAVENFLAGLSVYFNLR